MISIYPNKNKSINIQELSRLKKGLNKYNLNVLVKDKQKAIIIKECSNAEINGKLVYFENDTRCVINVNDLPKDKTKKSYYFYIQLNHENGEYSDVKYKMINNMEDNDKITELFLFEFILNPSFEDKILNNGLIIPNSNKKNNIIAAFHGIFDKITIKKNKDSVILKQIDENNNTSFVLGNKNGNIYMADIETQNGIMINDNKLYLINDKNSGEIMTKNEYDKNLNNMIDINTNLLNIVKKIAPNDNLAILTEISNIENNINDIKKDLLIDNDKDIKNMVNQRKVFMSDVLKDKYITDVKTYFDRNQ